MKNRLKELRQERHLTLKQLGQEVNMRDNTLSQYETGKRNPKFEMWKKLADYFGVSAAYLLGLENDVDSYFTIKELEERNTQLIKDNVSLIKEIAFLVGKYPGAAAELAHFNREQKITNGFESQIEDFLEGEG